MKEIVEWKDAKGKTKQDYEKKKKKVSLINHFYLAGR
jgi:hypothetical protein